MMKTSESWGHLKCFEWVKGENTDINLQKSSISISISEGSIAEAKGEDSQVPGDRCTCIW